jgi:preprotein translocase subunit SecE
MAELGSVLFIFKSYPWDIGSGDADREIRAAKVLRKKTEQPQKEQAAKDVKGSSKTVAVGQKRGKVKSAETARKKSASKTEILNAPRGWWNSFQQYLGEVVHELRKVAWPSRKETIGSTTVVLVIVLLAAVFLGIVDLVLSRLVRLFVG